MGPPSYLRSVVDRKVVMRRMTVNNVLFRSLKNLVTPSSVQLFLFQLNAEPIWRRKYANLFTSASI